MNSKTKAAGLENKINNYKNPGALMTCLDKIRDFFVKYLRSARIKVGSGDIGLLVECSDKNWCSERPGSKN